MTGVSALMSSFGSTGPNLVMNLDAATYTGLSAGFNGSSQYFDIASTAAFGFGTADFTFECWWRPTVNQRSDVLDFWSDTGVGSYPVTRFDFGRVTSTTLDLYTDGTGGSGAKITGPTIASLLNAWHHIAITRQSGSIKMWVDGTQRGSTYSANVLDMGASMKLRIMGDHGASGNGSGNLSNVRVVTGVAVYTGAFTPPTSALALTQSSGTNISAITAGQTQLLLPLNVSPFTDSSTNAITVTNTGTVVPGVQYPFTATDATGTYTVTTRNANSSMAWATTNGGIFRKTTANTADFLEFGPNYSSTSQAYTVMMVYRSVSGTAGRLLNANTASPDWLMGLWASGSGVQDIFFNGAFIGSSSTAQNGAWRFAWMTFNGSTTTNAYAAGNAAPTTTHGTRSGNGGFNQLRLFGRFSNATTISEPVTADVGLVKIWDGVLTLAQIQTQWSAYNTRFGY